MVLVFRPRDWAEATASSGALNGARFLAGTGVPRSASPVYGEVPAAGCGARVPVPAGAVGVAVGAAWLPGANTASTVQSARTRVSSLASCGRPGMRVGLKWGPPSCTRASWGHDRAWVGTVEGQAAGIGTPSVR